MNLKNLNEKELDIKITINDSKDDPSKQQTNFSNTNLPKKPVQNQEPAENNPNEGSFFDLRRSAHPVAGFFTIFFKGLGIFAYLLLEALTGSKIATAILVIVAAAFDFWTVKNISGRLLVGLRWWSEIGEDGNEKWHFESYDTKVIINNFDKRLFWTTQIVATVFWAIITVMKTIFLSLFWAAVGLTCFMLSAINYYGHYKCSKEHQKKISDVLSRAALGTVKKGIGFSGF